MIASKYTSYTRSTGTYTFGCPHLSKQWQFCLNVKKEMYETSKVAFQRNSLLQTSKHRAVMVSYRVQLYSFSFVCENECSTRHLTTTSYYQVAKFANPNTPSFVKDFVSS
ncbi:hypothetical protein I79_002671 [Cricetulus griseus]|uniref:Uncharacterized protein n=1 Tax=Cricetulus griseus TaxID=10029 RepID=G3GY18_CRIGR|nr:hypothetical protein I79_002671 [Cricetulus griseus]